jgi:alkylated DNA repair dioxygenase AlkB
VETAQGVIWAYRPSGRSVLWRSRNSLHIFAARVPTAALDTGTAVLRVRVEEATPVAAYTNPGLPKLGYNAVLCNLYRDGNDSVGLHADAEPEMGPVIASVSLGAERIFRLKRKNGSVAFLERLPHGSLFVMAGDTQKHFKHEAPKEPRVTQPRINLTFRRIGHK